MTARKFVAELIGTALLVIVGVGVATLSFGFKLAGGSTSAGVVTTALAFGLVRLGLACVHLVGIPLTGTSVNPARSLGPALVVRGDALRQVWLFIVAPLVGGAGAAAVYRYLFPPEEQVAEPDAEPAVVADRQTG